MALNKLRVFTSSIYKHPKNVWSVTNVELLHKDINKINGLKDESYEGPFVITEIPPPLCPKCNSIIQNECKAFLSNIDYDDLDLMSNPKLLIKCPIFGEVKGFIDIDIFIKY